METPIESPVAARDESEGIEQGSWRIIDSIPAPVALLTNTGEVEMANRRLLEYFGATVEKTSHWQTNDLVHPEDLPHLIELFTRSIESGVPYESEQRLRRWDGVYRWFQASTFPVRDVNGQIVRWYVVLTDIEERKRTEDARRANGISS